MSLEEKAHQYLVDKGTLSVGDTFSARKVRSMLIEFSKAYAKAKLEEAAERATLNAYEYKKGEQVNIGNIGQEANIEDGGIEYYIATDKKSITETPLD